MPPGVASRPAWKNGLNLCCPATTAVEWVASAMSISGGGSRCRLYWHMAALRVFAKN